MYNSDSWYFTHLCYEGNMHCSSHCHFCSHFIKNTNMMFLTLKFSPFCCYFIFSMHKYTYLPYTIGWRYTACVKMSILTLRWLMSYTYGAPILDVSRSHTTRPLTCWERGFESHRGHGYLSVVSVVCCQVEVSATSWSLVQRSPTDCAASLCVT